LLHSLFHVVLLLLLLLVIRVSSPSVFHAQRIGPSLFLLLFLLPLPHALLPPLVLSR
jgi:hypothetical protein